jgi:signal transduction histidine kinase/ActR/RegA family two-component response regulator
MRKVQGGRDWWTQSSGTPMFDKEGRFLGYRGISRDVTEMKQLEGQLRQAQKMEAIGHLTGGIAHDFNNLLGIMKGNLELLRRHAPLDERGTNYLAEGLDAVARAAALTHRLLAFASRQPLQPRPSDIGDIIGGMEDLLRRTISENIDLEIILDTSAGSVLIDPRQLENAVLNLALNARDAMLKGGRLRIETSVGILDGTGLNLDANTGSGPCQVISVSDTGTGMPDELLQQAFDPFFTTKPFGRGSGLGLSMVHGFVRQSGGQVTMESRIGAGTVVRLYLPLILPLARTVAVAGMSIEDISPMRDGQIGQGRTVLIVEDDTELRNVAVEVMTDLDFIVLQAGDAEAARAVFESGVSVDLLFADVVLPGPINGLELVDLAREKNSGVMVLLCSGYAWETFETDKGDESGIDFISKPYGINELALAVEQVLVDG